MAMINVCLVCAILMVPGCFGYLNLKYTDCADRATDYFHAADGSVFVHPYPPKVPGNVTGGISIQVFRNLTAGDLSLNINISKILLGQEISLPCVNNLVGTCHYDDFCQLLDYFKYICDPYLKNSNIPCGCPFPAATYTLRHSDFVIDQIPALFASFADGDYKVKARWTDKRTNQQVGCYDIDATIASSSHGFIFG